MGDSQFAVGVKVVIDVEQERSRIGNIPQAGTGTSDVPSMMGFSGTFAQGQDERIKKLIDAEVEKALERQKSEPRERISGSATMIRGRLDLPKSEKAEDSLDENARVRAHALKARMGMMSFLESPLDAAVDASKIVAQATQGIPIVGEISGVAAAFLAAGRKTQRFLSSGAASFGKAALMEALNGLGLPVAVIDKISAGLDGAIRVATTVEAANNAVFPAFEQTVQFGAAMSRLGQGKQPMNPDTILDYAHGTFEIEYYQQKFGLKKKQWMATWAGEYTGKGLMEIVRQAQGM